MWPGINKISEDLSNRQLVAALQRTMTIFLYVLHEMIYTQERYLRLLANNVNANNNDTADLESCRSKLKHVYEATGPFIKQMIKNDTVAVKELTTILMETESSTEYSPKLLKTINKKIRALIHIECLYGQLLPYNKILWGMLTEDHDAEEALRELVERVAPQAHFKKVSQTLELILQNSGIKEDFHLILYKMFKRNIPLIDYSEPKFLARRASLQPGMVINPGTSSPMKLGQRLSVDREGRDDRIVFRVENRPDEVITFFRNRAFYHVQEIRIQEESCVALPAPTICYDAEGYWASESNFEPHPLPLPKFLQIIDKLFDDRIIQPIAFTEFLMDPETEMLKSIKPIFRQPDDFDGLVDSLITLYHSGAYSKECPSLHEFLRACLGNAKPHHKQFFSELAFEAASLPLNVFPREISLVIETAVGKKYLISSTATEESIRMKCTQFVNEILEMRTKIAIESSEIEETKFIEQFAKTLAEQVCAWTLPPKM
jgi:hypothetical protein